MTQPYTLGLDIGIASVGAALLSSEKQCILALHVRTFDKAETAKGESLNKIRRDARSVRRRLRRRRHRLLRLMRLLRREGIVGGLDQAEVTSDGSSPWELRAAGLDRLLLPSEWATTLYHLVKHRGFQSTRKSEAKADAKTGEMLTGVKANQGLLAHSGFRSVGELICRHADFSDAKRNKRGGYKHTFARADIVSEAQLLFERQRSFGNPLAGEALEGKVTTLLLERRPVLSGNDLLRMVGHCTLEPLEYRAPRASYRAERFVWLAKLNNLKIVSMGSSRVLTEPERRAVLDLPFQRAKLTYKQLRAALNLDSSSRFNLLSYRVSTKGAAKDPEDETMFEAKSFHRIRKSYEAAGLDAQWQRDAADADRLDDVAYALTCFKDDAESRAWLAEHGFESAIVEAVLEESFEKFTNLSRKALKALLPFLERGQRYDEAAVSAGYHHSDIAGKGAATRHLPPPDRESIRNPVVYRALNQARKLVNAIVDRYGPPAEIHIELARDLSRSFDERNRIEREQKVYQEQKQEAGKTFADMFGREPRGPDLLKWRLFREQLDQCPYCQRGLDANRLFEVGYSQVDHVLPYSRSFDDSQNNKVVVHTACNQDKGNRTPYEVFGGAEESPRWQSFSAWVSGNKGIRQAKRNRLLRANFGEEEASEFRDRNLGDTRFICREFKRALEQQLLWHPDTKGESRCVVVAGQLTALLRTRWGLLKVRENGDLHHALDAAVVAAASRSFVQRMALYSKRKELGSVRGDFVDPQTGEIVDIAALRAAEDHFPEPWPNFRVELEAGLSDDPAGKLQGLPGYDTDLLARIKPVRVSRAPTRRGLGAAHQDTIRSVREDEQSSVKTPLSDLTLNDLERIVGYGRDTALISAIQSRLEEFGGNAKKAFGPDQPPLHKPSRPGRPSPVIHSVQLLSAKKQNSGISVRGGIANNGAMLRVDVFTKGGKFFAVPIYVSDVIKPELPNRAVVAHEPESKWTVMDASYAFLWSLYQNDWVEVRLKDEIREGYFGGFDRATGAISVWTHDRDPRRVKNGQWTGVGIKTAKSFRKFHVDCLGNLHLARLESRMPLTSNRG